MATTMSGPAAEEDVLAGTLTKWHGPVSQELRRGVRHDADRPLKTGAQRGRLGAPPVGGGVCEVHTSATKGMAGFRALTGVCGKQRGCWTCAGQFTPNVPLQCTGPFPGELPTSTPKTVLAANPQTART